MRLLLSLLLFLLSCAHAGELPAYQPRPGHERPVIAVLGDSVSTEITDFMLPYGVLQRADIAQVLAVATEGASITMNTGLRVQPDLDTTAFDQRYPDGADYVIVPAMRRAQLAPMLAWLQAQAAKGATVASICDGALVVANSGLLKGRRGTAHWATHAYRLEKYPDTEWLRNVRYVADGKVISSAGISAALPLSLALVEAIAGREKAAAVAAGLGVEDWSSRHDSAVYAPKFGHNLNVWLTHYTDRWLHGVTEVGLPLAEGFDEIALAYASDAYTRTHRSRVLAVASSAAALASRHGLRVLPDRVSGSANLPAAMLPTLDSSLDRVLAGIAGAFGARTAHRIALELEYPGYPVR
ncbi:MULTISPECIES: DJ-1/PfpI family protein [unclassified Duganella]|uniref:DJ-1/PfpI family protein n=1 Tax=unclassified Duganella TaxID=2636909 RepID=UPI0006F9F3B9|nr:MULTISPECIES: DJ-1/PfpI family protein [unclassified Duganella]KQV54314.1 transcriptional regulator [Duganella sp. Root336D2]KRC03440.1 transcriptional regulator [Duganella sp. Root198D2]